MGNGESVWSTGGKELPTRAAWELGVDTQRHLPRHCLRLFPGQEIIAEAVKFCAQGTRVEFGNQGKPPGQMQGQVVESRSWTEVTKTVSSVFASVTLSASSPCPAHLPSSLRALLGPIFMFDSGGTLATNCLSNSILHIGETETRERQPQVPDHPAGCEST